MTQICDQPNCPIEQRHTHDPDGTIWYSQGPAIGTLQKISATEYRVSGNRWAAFTTTELGAILGSLHRTSPATRDAGHDLADEILIEITRRKDTP